MKRIFTLILTVVLLLSIGATALATEYTGAVNPNSVLLMNADTGEVLYSKDETAAAYSAGLVKLMTAYVTVKNVDDLDSIVTVSSAALSSLSSGTTDITLYPRLSGGEQISVRDLLGGMLAASGNDAALALAYHVGGSIDGFVSMMNTCAQELGMSGTVYTNPTGKHYGGQYTTAADVAILASELLSYPDLVEIFSAKTYTIPATNLAYQRVAYNTNRLICEYSDTPNTVYEYATGMIAGYTSSSGGCLAATARKYGTNLVCIILGDVSTGRTERWTLAKDLFEYGFEFYVPVAAEDVLADIPLAYTDYEGIEYVVEADFTDITVPVNTPENIIATVVTDNTEYGTAVYTDENGIFIAEVPVTLTAIEPEVPEEPEETEPELPEEPEEPAADETPEISQEPEQQEAVPTQKPERVFNPKSLIALGASILVLALAALAAYLSARTKSKGHHKSENDSFRVKFRQNFMTWLLFGVIAVIIIVVLWIVIL